MGSPGIGHDLAIKPPPFPLQVLNTSLRQDEQNVPDKKLCGGGQRTPGNK